MSICIKPRHLLLLAVGAVALAGCETVKEEVDEVVGNNFRADLNGASEVPGPGDPDGWGKAAIAINDAANTICTDLEVRDIGDVTAAHIHRGGPGVAGPPVVNLDAPDDNDSDDCDTVDDALVDEIRNNPGGFYVNVHTAAYPDGAIRGQIVNVEKDGV
ncbi:MAG TPA: CHRD domain-containing protein [Allosphingosinicella sp.]